jgi:thioredoxin reductase (NADPH)
MTAEPETIADVLIVGAGPVGLFAVFACGQLGMRCVVVDALDEPGGQCISLYPDKPIYDIPARRSITAKALIDELLAQAAPFKPRYCLGHCVVSLARHVRGGWLVGTKEGLFVRCRAIMIAGGNGLFQPVRPPLAGIEAFEGRSVFYSVASIDALRGKRIVIAGGGDSALDWAVALGEVAAKLYLVHRRPRFRGAPATVEALYRLVEAGAIELVAPYQLSRLEGTAGRLAAVHVQEIGGGLRRLDADVLLPFFGLATDLGPLAQWGLDMAEQKIVVDPGTCATARPGIFAIGDIASYEGKLNLILTGFAEAAAAAHAAYPHVRPESELHFVHSTTRGDPALQTAS